MSPDGNGLLGVEQTLHRISEYLIQFYKGKNLIKRDYVKRWVPELKNVPKNLFINHGRLKMKNFKIRLRLSYAYSQT